jgi:hypothetical protein
MDQTLIKTIILEKLPTDFTCYIHCNYKKLANWVLFSFVRTNKESLILDDAWAVWRNCQEDYKDIYTWFKFRKLNSKNDKLNLRMLAFQDALSQATIWKIQAASKPINASNDKQGEIIIRFQDGFYWIKLKMHFNRHEGKVMKHCGRGYGNMYSLRKDGLSYLTADISNRRILQLKGKANSNPKNCYHPYITSLSLSNNVKSIKCSRKNFNLQNISEEQLNKLIESKPYLFDDQEVLESLTYQQWTQLLSLRPQTLPFYKLIWSSERFLTVPGQDPSFTQSITISQIKMALSSIETWKSLLEDYNLNYILLKFKASGEVFLNIIRKVFTDNEEIRNYVFLEHTSKCKNVFTVFSNGICDNLYSEIFVNTKIGFNHFKKGKKLHKYITILCCMIEWHEGALKTALNLMLEPNFKNSYILEQTEKKYQVVLDVLQTR